MYIPEPGVERISDRRSWFYRNGMLINKRDIPVREKKQAYFRDSIKLSGTVLKRDRTVAFVLTALILGMILLSLANYDIQPYIVTQSYTDTLYSSHLDPAGYYVSNKKVNLYVEAPNFPIQITINDTGHNTLDYSIFYLNDTKSATGFGPSVVVMQGQINSTSEIAINNPSYQTMYTLSLSSPANASFNIPVTINQKAVLHPPANYWTLIPGVILTLVGAAGIGMKVTSISSDRSKYYMGLGINEDDLKIIRLSKDQARSRTAYSSFLGMVLGLFLCSAGFIFFGSNIFLSWVGVTSILVGLAFMLRGLVQFRSQI